MITVQLVPLVRMRGYRVRAAATANVRATSTTSRVLIVSILASMVAFLDSTVVNVALPAMERDLGGGLSLQQWVVDAYLLALAASVLSGGSIADLFGRVPVMRLGLAAFGVGSMLAATATWPAMLIAGRVVQGVGGAFLVPGSLALINSAFDRAHRPAAIGSWTAWTSTAFALGPMLGGLAVDFLNWRWIYVLSAIPMVIGFALTFWLYPMPKPAGPARVDVVGAALSATGLSATVYGLVESDRRGWSNPVVTVAIISGVAALLAFLAWERRAPHPMMPLSLFRVRNFAGANLATAFVYGALTMGTLAIGLYTQEVAGYSATAAGLVTLPSPLMSFLFARRVGGMAARIGPHVFLMAGPALAGFGLLLIRPSAHGFNVVTQLLPGVVVLATGLVLTITPLSAVNLSSVEPARSGIAAAIQNMTGRTSALMAVACVGFIAVGTLNDASFARLLQISAVLFFIGAAVSGVTIVNPTVPRKARSRRGRHVVTRPFRGLTWSASLFHRGAA
jgi:EmrB/QacA subfamily drug resistance transporter